jgi:hypothetical protein
MFGHMLPFAHVNLASQPEACLSLTVTIQIRLHIHQCVRLVSLSTESSICELLAFTSRYCAKQSSQEV